MIDTKKIVTKHALHIRAALLLGALVGGCLALAPSVYADTSASQMQAMQNKLNAMQDQLSELTSGLATRSNSNEGLPLHGFMDVGFASNSQRANDPTNLNANPNVANPKGFYEGRLSFYMAPHFGDRVVALAEPNFEVSQLDGSVNVDIERLQIGYTFSDTTTVWGGRFHTPYGYWNTAFHHGAQLQTAILRPRFLDFEDSGGILPAHMVGLWGTGKVRAGSGKFTYDWYVGNGPKIVDATVGPTPPGSYQGGGLDPNIAGDDNHSAMVGANLGYDFSGSLDGLRLAMHALQGDVAAYDATGAALNTTGLGMIGGAAIYITGDWEVMSEYYNFKNKDKSGGTGTHKSWADYLQIGKSFNNWVPFIRFERAVLDQNDNYFSMQASGQSYAREVLGLRYNLSPKAALKFELGNSSFKQETGRTALGYRSFNAQYAIGF